MARFSIDGLEYHSDKLSTEAEKICNKLLQSSQKISEKENLMAILRRARNAYIEDIKNEIVSDKLGVDLREFFTED